MAVHGMRRFAGNKPVFAAALVSSLLSSAALADPPQLTVGPVYTNSFGFDTATLLLGSERNLAIPFTTLQALPVEYFDSAGVRGAIAVSSPTVVPSAFVPSTYIPGAFAADDGFLVNTDAVPTDTFTRTFSFTLTQSTVTNVTTAGGGVTAIVRAGGNKLGTATSATSADAQAAALSGISIDSLGGRALTPVASTGGLTEIVTETSLTQLTGRDTYLAQSVTFGPDHILIGNLGRCSGANDDCEGGTTFVLGNLLTQFDSRTFQDLYVTTTINRLITSTGTVFLDIPLAGYGNAHPAAQAVGFELGGVFLRRLLSESEGAVVEEGDGGTAPFTVFIEAAGDAGRFGTHDGFAASDYSFAGLRGGIAFAIDPQMTLGAAFEAGAWSWQSNDPLIPESADGETYKLGAFAKWRPGAWRVNAALFAGQQHVEGATGATLGGAGLSSYNATVFGAGVEIGHEFAMAGLAVTPSAGLDVLGWSSPATVETGGLAPLTIAAASQIQARPNIGVKLAKSIALENGGTLDLGASAKLLWTLGDQARSVTSSGGTSYTVDGPTNGVGAEIGMNASVAVSQLASLTGAVAARFSESGNSFGGNVGFKMKF